MEWIKKELKARGWSQNELARRAGLSSGAVSNVMTQLRQPGPDFCTGIARAFRLSPEEVFRRAGLLPPKPENSEDMTLRELWSILREMSPQQRREARRYLLYLTRQEKDMTPLPENN